MSDKTEILDENTFDPRQEQKKENVQKEQAKEKQATQKKKKNHSNILYGVAGAAAGAGVLFTSQALGANDEVVDAEIMDDVAGMDSVLIGDTNGVVNAVIVDTDGDGTYDGALNINPIGGNNENANSPNEEVINTVASNQTTGDEVVEGNIESGHEQIAGMNSINVDANNDGTMDSVYVDTNNDGIFDSEIEIVNVAEVVEPEASDVIDSDPVISESYDVSPTDTLDVAGSVTDDMSFSDAFAAARDEVGAGGIFYWKGEPYGTYYENEWNAMSEDDQSEYWDSVSLTTHVQDDEYADVDDIFDDHSIDTEPGSIEIANNDADTNDTDPFGSDFDNNADMDDWA